MALGEDEQLNGMTPEQGHDLGTFRESARRLRAVVEQARIDIKAGRPFQAVGKLESDECDAALAGMQGW